MKNEERKRGMTLMVNSSFFVLHFQVSVSRYLLYSLNRPQLLDECLQSARVAHHDSQRAREEAVVRVNADAAQRDACFLRDDGSDIGHNTDVVVTHHTQSDGVLRAFALTGPASLHNTVAETGMQLGGIRAIAAVYLDAASHTDEAEHVVSRTRRHHKWGCNTWPA